MYKVLQRQSKGYYFIKDVALAIAARQAGWIGKNFAFVIVNLSSCYLQFLFLFTSSFGILVLAAVAVSQSQTTQLFYFLGELNYLF